MKAFVIYLALLTVVTLLTGEFHVHRILGMVTVMGILALPLAMPFILK